MGDTSAAFRHMKADDVLLHLKYALICSQIFQVHKCIKTCFHYLKNTLTNSTYPLMVQQIMGDDTLKGLTHA